jgi:hypothetical protein
MNLGAAAVVLRPRSLGEIFDLACRLSFSIAFRLYLALSALVLLPCLAACLALHHAAEWAWSDVWVVAISLGALVQGVFTLAMGRLLFSEALGARQVLRLFLKRLPSYFAMLLASRCLLGLAALPMLLALPLVWPRLLHVHEASLLEAAGATDAIRRSSRFIAGRGAGAFAVLLGLLCVQGGFVIVSEVLGQGLVDDVLQLGKPFGALFKHGGSAYALIGFFLSVPYVATARFLSYIDARTRADGWDIQLRFMNIAAHESAERRLA